jgi:hypothetical protein
VAAGPVEEAVTDQSVSATFGVDVAVERVGGRLAARVRRPADDATDPAPRPDGDAEPTGPRRRSGRHVS